ncbi:hypothetical protein BDW66DRAFT_153588 [Aspergillus desertorum]
MSDGHTPCVALAQKSLATYFDSQPGHRLLEGFVHEKGHKVGEACHRHFVETGLLTLKECFSSYREDWLGLLPGYEGPALTLEGDATQKVEFPEDLIDLSKSHMLKYTVEHLTAHAASIKNTNELSELFRTLDYHSADVQCIRLPRTSSQGRLECCAETENGQTLLHWAAYYNSRESMEVILSTNFDNLDAKQKHALGEVAPLFLIEYSLHMLNYQKKQHSRTVLQLAAAKGHVNAVDLLPIYGQLLRDKLLVSLGSSGTDSQEAEPTVEGLNPGVNLLSIDGCSPLHYGACSKQPGVVAALLAKGADWRLKNKRGESPLQSCANLKEASFADIGLPRPLKSDTGVVDTQFYAHKVEFNGAKPTVSRLPIKQLLSVRCSILVDGSNCTWIHLPANNVGTRHISLDMILANMLLAIDVVGRDPPLASPLAKRSKNPTASRDEILRRELWTDRHTRGSPRPFISFMRSGREKIDLPESTADSMVLFMPYIHWETQEKQMILEYFSLCKFIAELEPGMVRGLLSQLVTEQPGRTLLQDTKGAPILQHLCGIISMYSTAIRTQDPGSHWVRAVEDPLRRRETISQSKHLASVPDLDLIDLYASNATRSHPLHPRRTLDQYFYYTLSNTTHRNQDQVVARHGRIQGKKQPVVLMVDQLWLWRIGGIIFCTHVVVSCFPQRRECGVDDPDRFDTTDVFENILASLTADPLNPRMEIPMELVLRIMRECSSTCFDPMKYLDDDFQFLDIFNDSINQVADQEVNCYKHFVDTLRTSSHHLHDQRQTDRESQHKEFHLLREIKDIIEDLRMLRQVFDEQQDVLSSMTGKVPLSFVRELHEALIAEGVRYTRRIDVMQREAERTSHSVGLAHSKSCSSILIKHPLTRPRSTVSWSSANAMPLCQRLKQQADRGTQSWFTVVTILFLPAFFMASFFALPVARFARVPGDAENMDLTRIVRWLLVFTVPVAVLFISLAFYINDVLYFLSRAGVVVYIKATMITNRASKFLNWEIAIYRRLVGLVVRPGLKFKPLRRGVDADKGVVGHNPAARPEHKSPPDEESAQLDLRRRKAFRL